MKFEEFICKNIDYLFCTLKELCLIPAPSHHEEKRAEYCKKWLEENGAEGVYIDDSLNVVLPINIEGSDKITVFAAHTDTVFPDLEPMPYKEEGDRIYCPAVGDDTASVCVVMMGAKYFIENKLSPKGGVLFVLNSCEEGLGNLKGMRKLFEDYKGRIKQFVTVDSTLNAIADSSVGSHRYNVKVKTCGGHSYENFGNKNAIVELSKIAAKIFEIEVPYKKGSRTTYNVGIIEGGTSVNTIAENASMLCEYRSTELKCLNIMQKKFEKIFSDANKDDVIVTVEKIGDRPCSDIDAEVQNSFAMKCKEIVESIVEGEVILGSASTDCNIPLSLGVPAVAVGARDGEGIHTRDEWASRESIIKGFELFLNLTTKLLEV